MPEILQSSFLAAAVRVRCRVKSFHDLGKSNSVKFRPYLELRSPQSLANTVSAAQICHRSADGTCRNSGAAYEHAGLGGACHAIRVVRVQVPTWYGFMLSTTLDSHQGYVWDVEPRPFNTRLVHSAVANSSSGRREAHIQAQIQFQAVRQVLHRDARDPRPQILNPNPKYDPKHHPKERSQSLSCETASLTPSGSLSLAQGRQRCVKLACRAKVPKP